MSPAPFYLLEFITYYFSQGVLCQARSLEWIPISKIHRGGAALYAGGSFTSVDGIQSNNIAKWEFERLEIFRRGDVDGNGKLDITDAIIYLNYAFVGSEEAPVCLDAADVDDNGTLDVTDAINRLNYQFVGTGDPPAAPGHETCGPDPDQGEDNDAFLPCVYPPANCEE